MDHITTFSALQQIASTFLNTLQDRILNALVADQTNDLSALTQTRVRRSVIWQIGATATIGATSAVMVDSSIDWRNRWLLIRWTRLNNATDLLGGAAEQFVNAQFEAGTGITDATQLYTGAGNAASNRAAGDYYVDEPGGVLRFYCDGSGDLFAYNLSGVAERVLLVVEEFTLIT